MSAQRELLRAAGWQRVARLQRRLSSAGKAGIDAVLAVLGIDGRFNRGSQQASVNHPPSTVHTIHAALYRPSSMGDAMAGW